MVHDELCEARQRGPAWTGTLGGECLCAVRAYKRDPCRDDDGKPILGPEDLRG